MTDQPSTAPDRFVHLGLLLATPWLLVLVNRNLFFTVGGNIYIDPWLYTGYFLDLPNMLHRYAGAYYGSRLSWLLPGYVVHAIFPPLVANYALKLTFFYALLASTYGLVASGLNRRVAMLATLVMAWNTNILAAIGWDYVDGAGIVFIVATLACLERATHADRGRGLWAVAGGCGAACAASSNLFLLAFWPLCSLFVILRMGIARRRDVVVIALQAAVGAAVAFAIFGFVNQWFGGEWMYLAPQLRTGRSLAGAPNPWRLPFSAWLTHAMWLVLPATAVIGALASFWPRLRPSSPFARAMQWLILAGATLWIAIHASGTPVLQISYYSSYLAPLAILALVPLFTERYERLADRTAVLLELATTAILAFGFLFISGDIAGFYTRLQETLNERLPILTWSGPYSYQGFCVALGLLAGLVLVAGVRRVKSPAPRWAAFAAGMVIVTSCGAPADFPSRETWYTRPYFVGTADAHRFIADHVGSKPLRIWMSDPRGTKRPIIGVASTFLWGFALVNYEFPRLKPDEAKALTRDTHLVFLLPAADAVEEARAPLRQFGIDFDIVAQRDFGDGELRLAVVIATLK